VVIATLALWAVAALALAALAGFVPELVGRPLAPYFAGGLARMLIFVACLLVVWGALALAAGVVNFSMFALLVTRMYLELGEPRDPRGPVEGAAASPARPLFGGRRGRAAAALVALLAVAGVALALFLAAPGRRQVVVIAHRGASIAAPENSLAAFRLAVEHRADFYELDVQESKDGVVVVVHDSDLMKIGGAAAKIWEATAEELRGVDIGSRVGPQFASERVPTLDEALGLERGGTRVVVELKSYGHDERLVERVIEIVEATGDANCCIFMSLDHDMVRRLKALRPAWTAGVLVAKAMGDLSTVDADFLAVEARMATPRFVRRAHRAGKSVYVWTLNDPAWMLTAMGRGVDGLITDKPEVARAVVERYSQFSLAQRFLVAVLVRLGARTESLAALDALRP
jgi:glycerophosphoryl diester phosphodiesterase